MSTKTPLLPQSISTTSKSLLKDNVLLEDMARNTFSLLSEEEKSPLVKKSSRNTQKTRTYTTTPHKRKRTGSNRKARKRKSHAKIFSMTSPSPNKDQLNSADEATSKLKDEFEEMNSPKMYGVLIGLLYVSLCRSSFSEITNAITLKLPNIHPFFDFEILS